MPNAIQNDAALERGFDGVEAIIHLALRSITTREQAIALKERLTRPLGILNSRFELQTNAGNKKRLTGGAK